MRLRSDIASPKTERSADGLFWAEPAGAAGQCMVGGATFIVCILYYNLTLLRNNAAIHAFFSPRGT